MTEFEDSLTHIKNSAGNNSQKIKAFYQLCKEHNAEPVILRLSGAVQKRFAPTSYLVTFTTTRVIVTEKSGLRRLLDFGYVAGLGPHLYYLLSDKVRLEDVKLKDSFVQGSGLSTGFNSAKDFYILYDEIQKLVFSHGIKTLTTNMLGSAVSHNFLDIHTKSAIHKFVISAKQNGEYEKIYYWLNVSLPVKVHEG
jgi:sRNA-binding regulator protein Hfq